MANYKKFGELKKNDYVFSAEVIDSSLKQNCVGHIYNRYIIRDITTSGNNMVFTLAYDKSVFIKDFDVKKDNTEIIIVPFKSEDSLKTFNLKKSTDNSINLKILSTNIEEIDEAIEQVLKTLESIEKEHEAIIREIRAKMSGIEMNFSYRRHMNKEFRNCNVKPQYQEVVTTEEVYV